MREFYVEVVWRGPNKKEEMRVIARTDEDAKKIAEILLRRTIAEGCVIEEVNVMDSGAL